MGHKHHETREAAFFSRGFTIKGECWEWNGAVSNNGYGHFRFRQKTFAAHRVSFELHVSPISPKMLVLHSCDNRKCINPNHLWMGTQADNIEDMLSKGRGRHQKEQATWQA